MIFLLISCFSFFLISKSYLCPHSLRNRRVGLRIELPHLVTSWFGNGMANASIIFHFSSTIMPVVLENDKLKPDATWQEEEVSLLNLPDLALESILERLSPASLCSMAGVCTSLRYRCTSDHLWERHMNQKWGRLIGGAAHREWQWHITNSSRNKSTLLNGTRQRTVFGNVTSLWPFQWNRLKLASDSFSEPRNPMPVDSIMARYIALERGDFWFPAQVYNRENGHGFMLSCYDAELSYDCISDTFRARYLSHGRRIIEENIGWDRLRPPAVDNPAYTLYASDCLDDLKPGDHFEIQWRRNKDFPYGWWYGVVGHLESCNGNKLHCHCHGNETVILEFKQFAPGSRWRQTAINRKQHREIGNEADGFYGGMRKLYNEEEIAVWKSLSPTQFLE
ncbi:hypothetical protein NMG60_11001206 [Bertholletia excelsa]